MVAITTSFLLTSCQLGRFVFYNFADLNDHKKFQSRPLHNDANTFNFPKANSGKFPKELSETWKK